jgi:hypothetical protein
MDALRTSSAKFDERRKQDHIVFWLNIAEKLNYFDGPDVSPQGNWKTQINKDEAILLGEFASIKNETVWSKWIEVLNSLVAGNTQLTMQKQWAYLFDLVFNAVLFVDSLNNELQHGSELKSWVESRALHMAPAFKNWVAFYKASVLKPTQANHVFNFNYTLPELLSPWSKSEDLQNTRLSSLWFDSGFGDFKTYYDSIAPNDLLFVGVTQNPTSPKDFISLGSHYAGVVETGKTLLSFFGSVVNKANEYFLKSLENNNHEPHTSLLLTFLELTQPVQDELNELLDRHYDYYLDEVLNVKPKEPQKDSVFVTAELAKLTESIFVKKGSFLKGGKDAEGALVLYQTDKDIVLNKAAVASLKSFYRNGSSLNVGNPNTFDGLEAELEFPEQGWSPFGKGNFPKPTIGAALSGDLYRLAEGERTIEITFLANQNIGLSSAEVFKKVTAFYTSEKGWEEFAQNKMELSISGKNFKIALVANAEQPAIVEFNTKAHERKVYKNEPVLELYFAEDLAYKLREVKLSKVDTRVLVNGLKQVSLTNKLGNIDPSKAFMPFGPNPGKGEFMILGSSELFSKNIFAAALKINWKIDPGYKNQTWANTTIKQELLESNVWVETDGTHTKSKSFKSFLEDTSFSFSKNSLIKSNEPQAFSSKSTSGFLKLTMEDTIGHEGYQESYLRASAEIAQTPATTTKLPTKPYSPEIEEISVVYSTKVYSTSLAETKSLLEREIQFYHITPFGGNPAHGNDLNEDNPNLVWDSTNEGEFFIGFSDYKPGTSINCLINSIEGSSNPLEKVPTVSWMYLESNQWKNFENSDIIDNTNGLIQSGIVTAAVPLRYKEPGTLMGEELFWIKASVLENNDAVCNVDTVTAQAFQATLSSEELHESHFQSPLPSGTIKKFTNPLTGVKRVGQPAVSFGGSPKEDNEEFRNRTSKRLRHKDRNVQMLDYEQLVLQEFSSLKKVRCLSHTKYEEDESTNVVHYSESAPGHVTLITLPKIVENIEPGIKRFTPISTLEKIKEFIQTKASPFSTIHVKNPIYYEVELKFKVAFNKHILEIEFYRAKLQESLIQFLSPFDTGFRKATFQSTIHKSEIIDFIDEQPYVHYLKDLVMDVYVDREEDKKNSFNVETAASDIQVALLVSAKEHSITNI